MSQEITTFAPEKLLKYETNIFFITVFLPTMHLASGTIFRYVTRNVYPDGKQCAGCE